MSIVYVILINVILLFIAYLVLNHKINKNSTSALLDKYAREVENLIVELNRTLDDVLNLSEERVNELKKLIKKAEKTLLSERSAPEDTGAPTASAGREAAAVMGPPVRGTKGERKAKGADAKPAGKGVPQASVQPTAVPLYDVRGKKVDVTTPSADEGLRESPRTANIFERTRHLLSMGHSKDEIAKMLNLSRAEMEFLASLHNK